MAIITFSSRELENEEMGSFEESYDREALRSFTQEQSALLRELHQKLDAKYDEIAAHIAKQLNYDEDDSRSHEEAEEAIRLWEEGVEMDPARWPIAAEPTDKLQQLLKERHEIVESILDVRDEWSDDEN
jgi:hypothetical protein